MSDSFATPWTIACQVPQSMGFPSKNTGCCCSAAKLCPTPWTAARQSSLSFTLSWSLLKLTATEPGMLSSHLILCHSSPFALNLSPVSQLFASSGGQCIGASALASVLPMNIQGWLLLGLSGLICLLSKGLSRVLSSTTIWKHQFFSAKPSLRSNSHICIWLLEKP